MWRQARLYGGGGGDDTPEDSSEPFVATTFSEPSIEPSLYFLSQYVRKDMGEATIASIN